MTKVIISVKTNSGSIFVFLLNKDTDIAVGKGFYCKASGHTIPKGARNDAQRERLGAKKNWKVYEEKEVTNQKLLSRLKPLFTEYFEPEEVLEHRPATHSPFENLGRMLVAKERK